MGVLEISSREELERSLEDKHRTVIIDFWSEINGPCRVMIPVLEYFYGKHSDKVNIVKVNINQFPELAEEYEINTVPTMVIYQGGVERDERIVGSVPASVMATSIFLD